jgi:hypothetical protein
MDKQTIIDEIKRTAAENGGKPLGHRKLGSEAGIRETDWKKYWARFSEAQREAGFEPNVKTAALDEAELIKPLLNLARELGRFPTHGEMGVTAHADSTFPSLRTFRKRLGIKPQMVSRVATFCKSQPEFGDLLELCIITTQAESNEKVDTQSDGFVYLLKSGRFHKIGRTNSVGMREYTLKIQLPEQARIVHHIKTDDPVGIEAYWHQRFAPKRKNDEWFDLSTEDISAFRRRKFM